MFDSFRKKNRAVLVDHLDRPIETASPALVRAAPAEPLHPLNDPDVWLAEPAIDPPADIDIVQAQKWIDSLMGTTRGGESIYKLIWNGDRSYWYEFFTEWNSLGKPTKPVTRRPRVRYKVLRDPVTNQIVRDIFPPRWLILTRIEPEQYADSWKEGSWVPYPMLYGWHFNEQTKQLEPEYRMVIKQIRPDVPPPVFWVWYTTAATHTAYCCAQAHRDKHLCFGKYASPYQLQELLENQRAADLSQGQRSPFDKIDAGFIDEIEDQNNGYALEMAEMEVESQVFIENPMALIGIEAGARAGIDSAKQAQQIVRDHYERKTEELSKLI